MGRRNTNSDTSLHQEIQHLKGIFRPLSDPGTYLEPAYMASVYIHISQSLNKSSASHCAELLNGHTQSSVLPEMVSGYKEAKDCRER